MICVATWVTWLLSMAKPMPGAGAAIMRLESSGIEDTRVSSDGGRRDPAIRALGRSTERRPWREASRRRIA